jgi:hypothetical protein
MLQEEIKKKTQDGIEFDPFLRLQKRKHDSLHHNFLQEHSIACLLQLFYRLKKTANEQAGWLHQIWFRPTPMSVFGRRGTSHK